MAMIKNNDNERQCLWLLVPRWRTARSFSRKNQYLTQTPPPRCFQSKGGCNQCSAVCSRSIKENHTPINNDHNHINININNNSINNHPPAAHQLKQRGKVCVCSSSPPVCRAACVLDTSEWAPNWAAADLIITFAVYLIPDTFKRDLAPGRAIQHQTNDGN